MPISVSCSCGKKLSVKDELAGKRGKCPACGSMLTIPQPAKPAEIEEWGLAPLDDDPKPTKPAAAKPTAAVAKPQAKGQTTAPPLKPAPTKTSANATPAKNSLGGAAPALLDLQPLDEQGNLATASAASTADGAAKPRAAAAAPAKKPISGPAPLDLPALEGGEGQNHAAWIDEGAETEFKLDGPALKAPAGTFGTPMTSTTSLGHNEPEGELSCPRCGARLKRTLTVWTLPIRLLIGRLIELFNGPFVPFKCHQCGLFHYEDLNGPSRREAERSATPYTLKVMAGSLLLVAVIGSVGISMIMYLADAPNRKFQQDLEKQRVEQQQRWESNRNPTPLSPSSPPKSQGTPKSTRTFEETRKLQEEHRRRVEEQLKRNREQNSQPSPLRPNSTPTPITPATPKPMPSPTPMQPVSPFEEVTLPPASSPMPMPVNPFQPVD